MIAVHVVQVDAVTAIGRGVETLWKALHAGKSGLSPVRRFATDRYVAHVAGCIPALDAEHPCSRLDALVDMLSSIADVPDGCHLLTASTKAGIDQLERTVRGQADRSDRLLGHHVANRVAAHLGLKGPRQNVSAACASATVALALGASRIAAGQADAVLVCGLDLISEFIFSGFSSLMALSPTMCRPFDVDRDGLLLGEGAAYVLLMSDPLRRREGRESLGCLAGWGVSGDAHHITAPSREGEGLIRAVGQALERAALAPDDIAAISAHGTGSVYNDAMELKAFGRLFEHRVPFHSVKGATGHTMGASGAIETVIGLWSLRHQCIPPTVGLGTPEPAAGGRVSALPQSIAGDSLLVTNSGFGGINAAVILARGGAS